MLLLLRAMEHTSLLESADRLLDVAATRCLADQPLPSPAISSAGWWASTSSWCRTECNAAFRRARTCAALMQAIAFDAATGMLLPLRSAPKNMGFRAPGVKTAAEMAGLGPRQWLSRGEKNRLERKVAPNDPGQAAETTNVRAYQAFWERKKFCVIESAR